MKKRFTICGVEAAYVGVMGILFAFLGWVIENTARFIIGRVIDSRFHLLPFISPYGLVPLAVQILIGNPNDLAPFGKKIFKERSAKTVFYSNLLTLLFLFIGIFFGELVVGNAWEYLFGVKLWNYSAQPFHVTQYAGLLSTLEFGFGMWALLHVVYRPLVKLLQKNGNYSLAKKVACIVIPILILDTTLMGVHIALFHQPPVYWSIHIPI